MPLSELHEQIAREAARFAESELDPRAAEVDEGKRPVELGALAAQGLIAPDLPAEAGGGPALLFLEPAALSVSSEPPRVGLRGLPARTVRLRGEARKLGGLELAREARDGARALAAPVAAGIASRALDEARRYAMLRH